MTNGEAVGPSPGVPRGGSSAPKQAGSTPRNASTPGLQLYYHQQASTDIPEVKYVGVNRRINPIPDVIVRVNRAAQAAIRKVSPGSPFQHYRLVSVQWVPLDKKPGAYYEGPLDPAIYYAANVIIEAPPVNQRFSGQFAPGLDRISDFLYPELLFMNPQPNPGAPLFLNAFYNGKGYLAGGCMGCHGFRQAYGTDWSFLLDRQRVREPEIHD